MITDDTDDIGSFTSVRLRCTRCGLRRRYEWDRLGDYAEFLAWCQDCMSDHFCAPKENDATQPQKANHES